VFAHPTHAPSMWCRFFAERTESAARRAGQVLDPACLTSATRFPEVSDYAGAIFLLSVAAIWFGTSNAGREIVAEQAIYRRERMVNLSVVNYVLSKFVMLSALSVIQCTVLLGIVYPALGLGGGSWNAFLPMLGMLVVTAMCATSIGLLLSTVVVSTEAAMALTPIALIPQVVLGGRLVPMTTKGWLESVMSFMPARWSFEGVLAAERHAVADSWRARACVRSGQGISNGWFDCALEEVRNHERGAGAMGFATMSHPWISFGVLAGMSLFLLVLVMVFLRRRDSV
ncbi:MAG: ABC transporter permease, partial [Deltaproteobacteria bacterium]